MNQIFGNFYRKFFVKTAGFIPAVSQGQRLYPGDFFQIRNGEILVIGNIFWNEIVDPAEGKVELGIKLNPHAWDFSDGVSKPYSGRGSGHAPLGGDFEFSRQVLAFSGHGSFSFKAFDPEMVRIANWEHLQQQLIIKLTQINFSFREVYVVTDIANASSWTLAVAGSEKGELEIASNEETFGLVNIFGLSSARTIQAKHIEYYYRETGRYPNFFKAKKLITNREEAKLITSNAITNLADKDDWANRFYRQELDFEPGRQIHYQGEGNLDLLDILKANELNPNTALRYFSWADASLDDIERLFYSYGI